MCSSHYVGHKYILRSGHFAPSHSIFSRPFKVNQQTNAADFTSGEGVIFKIEMML